MNETLLLGLGIISGMAVWKYAVKPTYLDEARDSLFDLRDAKLRKFFLNTERGLNDPLYVRIRELLNSLLRYTERATLAGFFITMLVLTKHRKDLETLTEAHDREFSSDDINVTEFCDKIREEANSIMMRYMIRTSVLGQILRFVMYSIIAVRTIAVSLKTYHRPIWTAACTAATGAAIVTTVVSHVVPGVSSNTVQRAFEAKAMQEI
jgi:hypothetical protein